MATTYVLRVTSAADCRDQLVIELSRMAEAESKRLVFKKSDELLMHARVEALLDAASYLRDLTLELVSVLPS